MCGVYTPGWVVDGREWRGFFQGQPLPPVDKRDGELLKAELSGDQVWVSYQDVAGNSETALIVHLAHLVFDHQTAVAAGENAGRLLSHQSVVHELHQARGPQSWAFKLSSLKMNREAIAVWITAEQQSKPLQVLGGWLE